MKYRVTMICEDTMQMSVVIAAISKSEGVELESAQPVEDESPARKKKHRYHDGKKNKGISSENLILTVLSNGPANAAKMQKAFVRHGFSEQSHYPSLSTTTKKGLTKHDGDEWALTAQGKKEAALLAPAPSS